VRADVELLWRYHDLGHRLEPADVVIGLGSHDLGVATCAAGLYQRGLAPLIVFTGAHVPTTADRFPRGEAVHYREHATALGVPADAILVEPAARNTGENLRFSRALLERHEIPVSTAILACRPYQQRRAHATAALQWPGVEFSCASLPMALDGYVASIGDADRVVNMLVGDTLRITAYADRGFALPQPMPDAVACACDRLVAAGYTARLPDPAK
jgi:uncharacterized SAM-binding protein YcdF (DUF218 family)